MLTNETNIVSSATEDEKQRQIREGKLGRSKCLVIQIKLHALIVTTYCFSDDQNVKKLSSDANSGLQRDRQVLKPTHQESRGIYLVPRRRWESKSNEEETQCSYQPDPVLND